MPLRIHIEPEISKYRTVRNDLEIPRIRSFSPVTPFTCYWERIRDNSHKKGRSNFSLILNKGRILMGGYTFLEKRYHLPFHYTKHSRWIQNADPGTLTGSPEYLWKSWWNYSSPALWEYIHAVLLVCTMGPAAVECWHVFLAFWGM